MDTTLVKLIDKNIDNDMYEGIEKAMSLYSNARFSKPSIHQLVTFRTNVRLFKDVRTWVALDNDINFINSFITEIFIQEQLNNRHGFRDLLFENMLMNYFNDDKNNINEASISPIFHIISLRRVFLKNKEFYNMLMSVLQSRHFYAYPTLVIIDHELKSFEKDNCLYYDYNDIVKLGYFELIKLENVYSKIKKYTGKQLNTVILNNANK